MLKVDISGQFKKDFKRCAKRGLQMEMLKSVIGTLAVPELLPDKNKDHTLSGKYSGYRECHIEPDWLLIYRFVGNHLELARTGTHSDLFKM